MRRHRRPLLELDDAVNGLFVTAVANSLRDRDTVGAKLKRRKFCGHQPVTDSHVGETIRFQDYPCRWKEVTMTTRS
jgi:hypothetical protein